MNPKWFGDSFDIVKRFFISTLKDAGYVVYVDPKFTGDWKGEEDAFLNFWVRNRSMGKSYSEIRQHYSWIPIRA